MDSLLSRYKLSWFRLKAIMLKEFQQMLRDPATAGLMIVTPLLQLVLFGYAINMTPKNLPTGVIDNDQSPYSRDFITTAAATDYFDILPRVYTDASAKDALISGDIQFILNFPQNFGKDIIKGKAPAVLLEVDATDPVASSSAVAALDFIASRLYEKESSAAIAKKPFFNAARLDVHSHFNPIYSTRWNIIPGLVGVILTMTLVLVTSMAIAKEFESGTQEFMLATPATPAEILVGKMVPYLFVGYVQIIIILVVGHFFMGVPLVGSTLLLVLLSLPFILSNLSVGFLISTIARTQIQASVCSIFFFLPSIMLSGFFFPFRGMPNWAQYLGNCLPLSHYLLIIRGVMLKGSSLIQLTKPLIAIFIFAAIAMASAILRYRGTLD